MSSPILRSWAVLRSRRRGLFRLLGLLAIVALPVLRSPALVMATEAAPQDTTALDSTDVDWSKVPEYRIVPGDKLVLDFGPNVIAPGGFLQHEVKVRPDGRITVFPAGNVLAAGHTPRELEGILVDLLAETMKQPRVVVEVSEIAGNEVHVLGSVNAPGSYPVTPFVTVLQAIAMAGGFKDGAAKNSVLVFHRYGARTVYVSRIQVDRALKRGSIESDMPLARFDIVYVPRSGIGNVETLVQQLFVPTASILTTGLVGWELFNLDRVFVRTPGVR
jgi:protein involved in polysaccharide export with SLBB domain